MGSGFDNPKQLVDDDVSALKDELERLRSENQNLKVDLERKNKENDDLKYEIQKTSSAEKENHNN